MRTLIWQPTLESVFQIGHTKPDARDEEIATRRLDEWDDGPMKPRVGDFVKVGDEYFRCALDWPDQMQICSQPGESGSFYLGDGGYVSMSGGLDHGFPMKNLVLTGERKAGNFWVFHHDDRCAYNSVGVRAICRVYGVFE
jgi:hypothetical protein